MQTIIANDIDSRLLPKSVKHIAFLLPSLMGGGAERTVIKMLKELSKTDIQLDLVVVSAHGLYRDQIPENVRLIDLKTRRVSEAVFSLARYLRQVHPPVLISNMTHLNTVVCLAKFLTRSKTALICVEHCHIGAEQSSRENTVYRMARWLYPKAADAVVAVSEGVKDSLEHAILAMRGKVEVIFPPVVDDALLAEAEAVVEHPWLGQEIPVYLAVGRLSDQKNFGTLIEAFYLVRKQRPARLLILGEGPCREVLEARILALNLGKDVAIPGFAANPYAYMRRADAFVLSSRYEGMPAVLIEAMACGCPVIATDCPSGPREILDNERFGSLVPVGDSGALAKAMAQTLDAPKPINLSEERAMQFSTARATHSFLALSARLTAPASATP